jgi:hypothetical protein
MNMKSQRPLTISQLKRRHGYPCVLALLLVLTFLGLPCIAQTPADDASSSDSMASLALARKRIQEYFDKFSDVICKESVTQLVLNGSGRTIYRENSAYDYQFQASGQSGTLKFNETRESRSPAFRDPARTLLVTTGFASLLLVAHPMYATSYTFEPDGNEMIEGVSYARIRFTPIQGASSPAALRLRGRNYPLPMSGALWIDPQSGAIVKLEANVDSGLTDLGLAAMHSEVHYALHQFHTPEESMWIPDSATIDVESPHQHWRNLHHFTEAKRFNVNIQQDIDPVHLENNPNQ